MWCPDWPLVAAGASGHPSAVLVANRVSACSQAARTDGVRIGQRRREAEAACPELVIVANDLSRDARAFEAVITAVARFTPEIELTRPGVCALPARAPSRYFGGESSLTPRLAEAATAAARGIDPASPSARVGIADTPFAARLASREGAIVPPGATAKWLEPLPLGVLGSPAVSQFLERLGVRTLGEFAGMDEGLVSARLGSEGARTHRLARGLDDHCLVLTAASPDLCAQRELDSPVDSIETLAFIGAALADELVSSLSSAGLACRLIRVDARTENDEEVSRSWRADRPFSARDMVDRLRWQLEGWFGSPGGPSAGITSIGLAVGEVTPDRGRQLGLIGGEAAPGDSLERAVSRLKGLLGHDAVGRAVPAGGRGPADQVRFVPFGEPLPDTPPQPWPGRLPSPSPSIVYREPPTVVFTDTAGSPLFVSGRGRLSGRPSQLVLSSAVRGVVAWAGPFPLDERWWDPAAHRRRARMQVLLEDGSAHLLAVEQGVWRMEASYD